MDYTYFDEDYFENGANKGTAYRQYIQSSRSSPLYREIAEACAALRPRRVLEIGCATGIIVAHLNNLGLETHGIDVSEWAVARREHSNVVLAGAEQLPFPDRHFDLIYSVHALEHVPGHLAVDAFREIARVSAPDAVQFHTLPIVGEGPYAGDRQEVIAGLRKDPTHHLLEDRTWWQSRFAEIGFEDLGAHLLFQHEDDPDLSISQLLLTSPGAGAERLQQVRAWNGRVLHRLAEERKTGQEALTRALVNAKFHRLRLSSRWADVEGLGSFTLDDDVLLTAAVRLDAPRPATLRFCFLSGNGDESDFIRTFEPGPNAYQFRRRDLLQRLGSAGQVRRVVFGGEGEGEAWVSLTVEKQDKVLFTL